MILIEIKDIKPMQRDKIPKYMDTVVHGAARMTLDMVNSAGHFPYLTGELARASMAEGVRKESDYTYFLGAAGVDYAPRVYDMPQRTNWTNPSTLAQWYDKEWQMNHATILSAAIKQADREVFK